MKSWKHDIGIRLLKFLNLAGMVLPFAVCWFWYYGARTNTDITFFLKMSVVLLYLILYVTFGRVYDAFLVSYYHVSEMVYSQMLAACISDGFIYIVICVLGGGFQPLWPGLIVIVAQAGVSILWSVCVNRWYFKHYPPRRTFIIYETRFGMDDLVAQYDLTKKFSVEKVFPAADVIQNINCLDEADTVFLSGVRSHNRNVIIKYCVDRGISALVLPRLGDVIMSGAKKLHILHLPVLLVQRYNPKPEYQIIKRFFDIVLSSLALVLFSPVFLVVSILIKRDGGPVFYKQDRLTKDGKVFKLIKFRSMRVDAEKDGVARLSTGENDDRITPVGRVIRKMRIDELPQIFNILQGSLSIVGPRPERPQIAAEYEKQMPEFRLRLQCKAGLTGYAQVYGKYNTTPYDKLMMDLMYISNPGLFQDLRIIFATIKILFKPESTEGIAVGATTAMESVSSSQTAEKTETESAS